MAIPLQPGAARWAALTAAAAGVAVLVLIIGITNPLHLRSAARLMQWAQPITAVALVLCLAAIVLTAQALGPVVRRRAGTRGVVGLAALTAAVTVVVVGTAGLSLWFTGPENERVVTRSADGRYQVVVAEWSAMIDPAWSVHVESRRGLLSRRREVWRSVEHVAPESVTFTGPLSLVVRGSDGKDYPVEFDAESLQPTPFHCLSPGYC